MASIAVCAAYYVIQFYVEWIMAGEFVIGAVTNILILSCVALVILRLLMNKYDTKNFMKRIFFLYIVQLLSFIIWKLSGIPVTFYYSNIIYAIVKVDLYNLAVCSWVVFLWACQMALTVCLFIDQKPSSKAIAV
jgi:hypothetical protein